MKALKSVAGFQIATGIIMTLNIVFFLMEPERSQLIPLAVHLLMLSLYAVEWMAGLLLWSRKPCGLTLSIAIQALHLITFDILKLGYKFAAMVDFYFYYRYSEAPGFDGAIGGRYGLVISDEIGNPMIAVNLIALLMLIILLKAKKVKEVSEDMDAIQIAESNG